MSFSSGVCRRISSSQAASRSPGAAGATPCLVGTYQCHNGQLVPLVLPVGVWHVLEVFPWDLFGLEPPRGSASAAVRPQRPSFRWAPPPSNTGNNPSGQPGRGE